MLKLLTLNLGCLKNFWRTDMYQLEDGNTSTLHEHHIMMDLLEKEWELSLPNKQEAVIEYAIKILRQDVVSDEFDWAMCEYIDIHSDDESYTPEFNEALDNWILGISPQSELEYDMLWSVTHSALDGAAQILYDMSFEDLFDNLGAAIKKVMGN